MNNIEDFIREGKIEAAADYCKTQNSPEGRILEKESQDLDALFLIS